MDYEKEAIDRAKLRKLLTVEVQTVSLEDLIIQKSVSERVKDWDDIENLISINEDKIDWNYLLEQINIFSEILDKSEIRIKILRFRDESRKY